MTADSLTIRDLLQLELNKRHHATAIERTVDELFDKSLIVEWIQKLIGVSDETLLAQRIEGATVERLSHAVSAYLFGISVRDNLDLRFNLLPKIMTNGKGDTFHFFWSMVCLCHDLGYNYENDCDKLGKMATPKGRKELFHISHDLFQVDEKDMERFGIEIGGNEGAWILETISLAQKYDSYRRHEKHISPDRAVIDHGIAGALILYDIFYQEYEKLLENRRAVRCQRLTRNRAAGPLGILTGAEKDASAVRFISCSLVIACTVARHNMWLASDDQRGTYAEYGLEALFPDAPNAKISGSSPLSQMLFLLDFIDTIDPIKGLFTREAERRTMSARELERRRQFLLDQVRIKFLYDASDGKDSPVYCGFSLCVDSDDIDGCFARHVDNTCRLDQWLDTRRPIVNESRTQIQYFVPVCPSEERIWPAGITDREVNALLLYEGCHVPGKYGDFYTLSKPYQTWNLLMMPGKIGEQVRVCVEGQTPHSLYIEEWKKTLSVLTDIFTAQCKYAIYRNPDGQELSAPLFRGDRAANFGLMEQCSGTFALTSASKGEFLTKFLKGKEEPHLLDISVDGDIPYFDYSDFFGEDYVYFDEQEVLLPPYIRMEVSELSDLELEEIGAVQHYKINLTGFDEIVVVASEVDMMAYLDENCQVSAMGLAELVRRREMDALPPEHPYWKWKETFQALCRLRMQDIHRAWFCCTSEG